MIENGTILAGYRIEDGLGREEAGERYRATQLSSGATVVLKVLPNGASGDHVFREQFHRDGKLQMTVDHPHMVAVYEVGENERGLFLATQLIMGPTLKDLILGRALELKLALRALGQVAAALDTAHDVGLVHRAIRPQVILIGAGDHAYLADFGLATSNGLSPSTAAGEFIGSVDYLSPEQIRGQTPSAESDIYSLTAVLFESLTGTVPFAGGTDEAVLQAHISEPPPLVTDVRRDLPEAVDRVVASGMAKDPAERYSSAGVLMEEMREAIDSPDMYNPYPPEESRARTRVRTALDRRSPRRPYDVPATSETASATVRASAAVSDASPPGASEAPSASHQAAAPPVVTEAALTGLQAAGETVEIDPGQTSNAVPPVQLRATDLDLDETKHPEPENQLRATDLDLDETKDPEPENQLRATDPGLDLLTNVDPQMHPRATEADVAVAVRPTSSVAPEWKMSSPRSRIAAAIVLVGVPLLALAAVGYLVGSWAAPSKDVSARAPVAPVDARTSSEAGLTLSHPADWQNAEAAIDGVEFASAVSLSAPNGRSGIVAAWSNAAHPTLLPLSLLDHVKDVPEREPVRLGNVEAYRYAQMRHESYVGTLDVFVAPTTRGVATIVCYAQEEALLAECNRIAATLDLGDADPLDLGPRPTYAKRLNSTIRGLDQARRQGRAELRQATGPSKQANAAEKVARAYERASLSLRSSEPGPEVASLNTTITKEMTRAGRAYRKLARAALAGRSKAYDEAARAISAAEAAVRDAILALEQAGYAVD